MEGVTRLPDRLEVVGLPAGYAARRAEEEQEEGCVAHSGSSAGSVLELRGDAATGKASGALGSSPAGGILSGAMPVGMCDVEAAEVELGEVRSDAPNASGGRSTYDFRSASSSPSDEPLRSRPRGPLSPRGACALLSADDSKNNKNAVLFSSLHRPE